MCISMKNSDATVMSELSSPGIDDTVRRKSSTISIGKSEEENLVEMDFLAVTTQYTRKTFRIIQDSFNFCHHSTPYK